MKAYPEQDIILDYFSHEKPKKDFSGFIEEMALADIVQLACLSGKDRLLEITGENVEGEIFFSQGEVVHAVCEGVEGEEAFYKIMSQGSGSFQLKNAGDMKRTIEIPWNFLLIESLRRADETPLPEHKEEDEDITVLVVDDSRIISQALEKIFREKMGVSDVLTAFNGKEALSILKEKKPNLITLDINMPVMAGDVTFKHIMIKSPSPVILMTSVSGTNNISKVMEFIRLGAIDFIPKPNDSPGWEIVAGRLEKIFKNLQSLELKNLRRAKMPRLCHKKQKPVHPAKKCLAIMGGLGGILETQRILGALPDNGSLSIICFIDVVKEFIPPLSSYMDSFSFYTISHVMDEVPLLASQCQIASMDEAWKVSHVPSMQLLEGSSVLNVNEFLSSAADVFGFNFMIFLLSGIDNNIKAGLDAVLHKGGRIFIQRPDTALSPETLERLVVHEMEEACIEPEELTELVREWMDE